MTYRGDETASVRIRPLGLKSGHLKCVFLSFLLADIAEDGNNIQVCSLMFAGLTFNRPATHLDPDKSVRAPRPIVSPDTKSKRAHLTRACCIGKCGEKSRPIGHMHALEKFSADEFSDGSTEQ